MAIIFERVSKRFGGRLVLPPVSWRLAPGERWLVRGASGVGKTTLLRLLAGLETPDGGRILGAEDARFTMCFQENRLCRSLSSVTNLALTVPAPDGREIRALLLELLPAETLSRSAGTLSGGMARRTALARAFYAPSDVVILDEPFTGLDAENRQKAVGFIERHLDGRALVLVSHEIAEFPGANILTLSEPEGGAT